MNIEPNNNFTLISDVQWNKQSNTLYISSGKIFLKCVRNLNHYSVFVHTRRNGYLLGDFKTYYVLDKRDGNVYRHYEDILEYVLNDIERLC